MKQRMKGLGLALIAILAMSVPASAAQAEEFESASYPVSITGVQLSALQFTIGANRSWKCSTVNFQSPSLEDATTTLSLDPSMTGCSMKIPNSESELDMTVSDEGCKLALLEPSGKQGKAGVDCPAGQGLTINLYNGKNVAHIDANLLCRYKAYGQTNLGSVGYTNGLWDITAGLNVWGIALTRVNGTKTNCGDVNQFMGISGNVRLQGNGGTSIWVG